MCNKDLELFQSLVRLTETNEAFYITKQELDEKYYWIFLYRIASYTDFLNENALEARGIMFEVDSEGNFIRLAARPPHKFFNLGENPKTLDLDHSDVTKVMNKEDGSLISTYWHNGELRLKTKGSIQSVQALQAMEWLNQPENADFRSLLTYLTNPEEKGITVNLEWTSPLNRIVLSYEKPSLIVLNMRYTSSECDENSASGMGYVDYPNDYMVKDELDFYKGKTLEELRAVEGVEGWVCQHSNGTWFKLKTSWYVHLHHNKDSVNNSKALFNAVLEETTDDLRQLFPDDDDVINRIELMESIVERYFNHNSALVDDFYETNKDLATKEYAILGQQSLDKMLFSVAMSKYNGKQLTIKDVMKKNHQIYTSEYEEELLKGGLLHVSETDALND